MPSVIKEINKEQLVEILENIYEDVDNLGASAVRYWIIRIIKSEKDGSKQQDYLVQDHVIEKVIGSAVLSGKYIYVRRDHSEHYDFSIQCNPNFELNNTLKRSNNLTTIILGITCIFIGYQACHEVKPNSDSAPATIKRAYDTTKISNEK
jgi:hypothetical protein